MKECERRARRSPKTVNRLIGISDGKNVLFFASELFDNFDLGKVYVLEFVRENKAGLGALAGKQAGVFRQQRMRIGDHVAEGAQIILLQHALYGRKNTGNFLASSDDFLIR